MRTPSTLDKVNIWNNFKKIQNQTKSLSCFKLKLSEGNFCWIKRIFLNNIYTMMIYNTKHSFLISKSFPMLDLIWWIASSEINERIAFYTCNLLAHAEFFVSEISLFYLKIHLLEHFLTLSFFSHCGQPFEQSLTCCEPFDLTSWHKSLNLFVLETHFM